MKAAAFFALLILAGAFASSLQNADTRDPISDFIRDLIGRISAFIEESGLDPIEVENFAYEYNGNFLKFKASIDDLILFGGSNIVIKKLFNNVLLSTYDFDVVLPELDFGVSNSGLGAVLGDYNLNAEFDGILSIKNIRLAGQVRYRGSIITGVEIVGITLQTSIGNIESNFNVIANGNDYSEVLDTFLNDTLPKALENYKNEINAFFADIIMAIISQTTT